MRLGGRDGSVLVAIDACGAADEVRGRNNLAVLTQYIAVLGSVEDEIVEGFRRGGGVPYERFPRFHAVMAEDSTQSVVSSLESHVLPLVPGLSDALQRGIDVLDVGCGSGRVINRLAALFSRSRFPGAQPLSRSHRRRRIGGPVKSVPENQIMRVLSGMLVVAFGVCLTGLAVLTAIKPQLAERVLRSFASSARAHYTEQSLRLIVGGAMAMFAPSMWYPYVFHLLGWMIVVTAVALLLLPWRWHHEFGKWAIPLVIAHMRLFALGAFALGLLVFYGASRVVFP